MNSMAEQLIMGHLRAIDGDSLRGIENYLLDQCIDVTTRDEAVSAAKVAIDKLVLEGKVERQPGNGMAQWIEIIWEN